MDKWEYLSAQSGRAERQRAQMREFVTRHWLELLGLVLAIIGLVLVGEAFQAKRTQTSGHLLWKHTTTTEVPLAQRLACLVIGIVLLGSAAVCLVLLIKRARRQAAQKKYLAILSGIEVLPVQEIAAKTSLTKDAVYRDIQAMIDSGAITDFYIDYAAERVISKKYIPKTSHKTVVVCRMCGAHNELIVGITRRCAACGEPLVLKAH